ncbi:MAG: outer membrane beta-barrel protein [Dysgonomonas sp.]|nr:outer membrane beta-barrel protein [Dysgonomonas sp.]
MIKKAIILVIIGLFSYNSAFCQKQTKHEVSVWGMGGSSSLKYDLKVGSASGGASGGFGVGYTYFVSNMIGLNTGLEFGFYKGTAKLNEIKNSYETTDWEGKDFLFKSTISNYEETQNACLLNIPIMLHIQLPLEKESKFYAAGGIKIGLPISGTYKVKKGTIKNTGYYKFEDYEYDRPEELGFGTFQANETNEDFDLSTAIILSLETGIKWKLQEKLGLYTGIYFDYGLNDIGKEDRVNQFVEYNPASPRDFYQHSILTSQYITDTKTDSFTNKIIPVAFGVKVRLAFDLN